MVRDETYVAEHGPHGRVDDSWHYEIVCRYGCIYLHGGNTLAASVDGHPNVAAQLRRLKCCRVHQDGDFGELTALFDAADFSIVAKIMRPRRRRQVTAEQKRAMLARLQGKTQACPQSPIEGHPTAHRTAVAAPDSSQVVLRQSSLF